MEGRKKMAQFAAWVPRAPILNNTKAAAEAYLGIVGGVRGLTPPLGTDCAQV